jgi:spermidine synthase
VAVPVVVVFIRGSRLILGGVPCAYLPLERQLLALFLAVVPISALFGLAFRRAAAVHVAGGGRLAGAYALECAGAAAAGIASTMAFKAGLETYALAWLSTVVAPAVLMAPREEPGTSVIVRSRPRAVTAAIVLVVAAIAVSIEGRTDRALTRWTHPSVIDTRDTPYGRVTITRNGEQISVFENDVLTYESETADNEQLPHLTALQHPAPRRILLLGGSAEQLDEQLSRHHPSTLDVVELDRAVGDATRRALETVGRESGAGGGTGASVHIADPRRFLERASDYDVIVVAMPEPVSGQTNRFYTREFFDACAARLGRDGVLGLRMQVPENYVVPSSLMRAASVVRALRESFDHVEILPAASAAVLFASNAALPPLETVVERAEARRLETRLVTPRYLAYVYGNDRRAALQRALGAVDVPSNRDAQPVAYLHAVTGWLSRFVPSLIGTRAWGVGGPGVWRTWWLALPTLVLAMLLLVARIKPGSRRALLAFTAGLSAMVLETIVLLDFQAKRGALFEDLGLLMTAFMGGSTLGAWRPWSSSRVLLLSELTLVSLVAGVTVAWSSGLGLMGSALLLVLVGASASSLFAAASGTVAREDTAAMGRLYGADLLGGCFGALLGSLVLIPLLGLDAAAFAVAALALIAALVG